MSSLSAPGFFYLAFPPIVQVRSQGQCGALIIKETFVPSNKEQGAFKLCLLKLFNSL